MTDANDPQRVLITGAYGLIGNLAYAHLAHSPARYEPYGLVRRQQPSTRLSDRFHEIPPERLRVADLADFAAVRQAVEGIQVVVHLAADPSGEHGWESLLHSNIEGAYHVFEAARLAGVQRVIFASTNQVVFGYTADLPYRLQREGRFDEIDLATYRPIDHTQPTRPANLYAASKVLGEALAHTYAFRHGLSCICLRIGWVLGDDRLPDPRFRHIWCSQRDIVQLIQRCIDAPQDLKFDVFFGHSDNRYNLVDIQHARDVLGYAPQDRAEDQLA